MKTFLVLWVAPVGFLWSWYLLSLNDISFGLYFFSRPLHDLVFQIYGEMLGVDPAEIPPMLFRAFIVDTGIVLAILALRYRRRIASFARRYVAKPSADSLSSAP